MFKLRCCLGLRDKAHPVLSGLTDRVHVPADGIELALVPLVRRVAAMARAGDLTCAQRRGDIRLVHEIGQVEDHARRDVCRRRGHVGERDGRNLAWRVRVATRWQAWQVEESATREAERWRERVSEDRLVQRAPTTILELGERLLGGARGLAHGDVEAASL